MQPLILVLYWAQNRCIWCQFEFRHGQDKIVASVIKPGSKLAKRPPEVEHLGEFTYLAQGILFGRRQAASGMAIGEKEIRFHGFYNTTKARQATYHTVHQVACAHEHCNMLARTQAQAPFEHLKPLVFPLKKPLILLFPVTPFPFPPPVHEEKRRTNHIQAELAKNLMRDNTYPHQLPYELWLEVSAHLIQESATLTALDKVRAKVREKSDHYTVVDFSGSRPVYATYVKINGKIYIKGLDNNPPPSERSIGTFTILVFQPTTEGRRRLVASKNATQPPQGGLHLYLAHDHVGVCQAFVVPTGDMDRFMSRRPYIPDVWWRYIQLGTGSISPLVNLNSHLRDVVLKPAHKVRDVLFKPVSSKTHSANTGFVDIPLSFHYSWDPLPRNPITIIDLTVSVSISRSTSPHSSVYMTSFELNGANTTGYSALFDNENIIGIVTHKHGENLSEVREKFQEIERATVSASSPGPPYWVYIPIDKGEYITDILCRRMEHDDEDLSYHLRKYSVISIGFTTNRGRTIDFGTHDHSWSSYRLHRVVRLADPSPGKPCRVWYNWCDALPNRDNSQLLAFEEESICFAMDPYNDEPGDGGPELPPFPTGTLRTLPGMSGPRKDWNGRDMPLLALTSTPELRNQHQRLKSISAISRYSECSLQNICEIEIAFDDNFFGVRIVTGLLVRYNEGKHKTVTLGSFRPDRVDPSRQPIKVGEDDYLSFKYYVRDVLQDGGGEVTEREGVCKWVKDVTCHKYVRGTMISRTGGENPFHNGEGDDFCLKVTQSGRLAWCVFGWRDLVKWFPDA